MADCEKLLAILEEKFGAKRDLAFSDQQIHQRRLTHIRVTHNIHKSCFMHINNRCCQTKKRIRMSDAFSIICGLFYFKLPS